MSDTTQSVAAIGKPESRMVGKKERISYGMADFGFQLVWGTISAYITFFYTDIFGIAASSLIILFIVARIWDSSNDLIMGFIADKAKMTRRGKYLPFMRWGVIPMAIMTVLMFTTPNFNQMGKLIWAYLTYTLTSAAFTVTNVPYNALLPSLTDNYQERTTLTAIRMTCMMLGAILLNVLTRPLYLALGKGNNALGIQLTVVIYMIIAIPLVLNCANVCKERVVHNDDDAKVRFRDAWKAVSLPWVLVVIMNVSMWVGQTLKISTAIYWLTYVLEKPQLVSLFVPVTMVCIVPSIIITPWLTKKFNGKRWPVLIGNLVAFCGSLVFMFSNNIVVLLIGAALGGFGFGPQIALSYSMMADCIDYGEWKSGIRAQAMLGSVGTFGNQLGSAIGGIVLTSLLTAGGYVANQAQTVASKAAISSAFVFIPVITMGVTIVAMLFYKLDGNFYQKIKLDLDQRRNATAEASQG